MTRRLTLRRERLAELTTGELRSVHAGSGQCFESLLPTCGCTGQYPTFRADCLEIVPPTEVRA